MVNLGSPDSPTAKDVKPYLDEFLMDERVIDVNPILRNIIVRGIILNTRPKKSAKASRLCAIFGETRLKMQLPKS